MKVYVEISEQEFEEFRAYRTGKKEEGRAVAEIVRELHRLCDAVRDCIDLREKEKKATVSSYEAAEKALRLVEALRLREWT